MKLDYLEYYAYIVTITEYFLELYISCVMHILPYVTGTINLDKSVHTNLSRLIFSYYQVNINTNSAAL